MKKHIGEIIAVKRKGKKLSQIELAELLTQKGINISNAGISSWEKGNSIPSAETFLTVCEILEIHDIYKDFLGENPSDPFRNLNAEGVQKALDYISLLEKSGDYPNTSDILELKPRIMKVALTRASAGTGNFLDEEIFEEMEIYDPVPPKADFGIYIDGDSMEPRFKDEQLVWIEQTDSLFPGEIGLFFLDGMTYLKKYAVSKAGTYLVSLNPKYKPIPVKEYSTFRIFGRLATE